MSKHLYKICHELSNGENFLKQFFAQTFQRPYNAQNPPQKNLFSFSGIEMVRT